MNHLSWTFQKFHDPLKYEGLIFPSFSTTLGDQQEALWVGVGWGRGGGEALTGLDFILTKMGRAGERSRSPQSWRGRDT